MAKAGRPSKFKKRYCKDVIEFLSEGYSVTAFAGHIKVARSTVFTWAESNDEFSDALKTGQALAALWWEKQLRNVARTGQGSASAAIFGVKNRSRAEWRDKPEDSSQESEAQPVAVIIQVEDGRKDAHS